jgi:hypothetical protein
MKKRAHTFKIGQEVFHHTEGLPRGKRIGPHTIVGLVRRSTGDTLKLATSRVVM